MTLTKLATALLFAALLTPAAFAQLAEDRVPAQRTVPLREQVRAELENYPRRLGPIRIFPQFELRNFGYNDNVFGTEEDPVSDYTATIGAGARYLVPFGRKVFLRGSLMPEYTYYHELEEHRTAGGTYNGSLLGLYNRMSFELGASRTDRVEAISSETERPAQSINDGVVARLEIDVLPRVALFGSFVERERSYESEDLSGEPVALFEELERTDDAVRGGLRYRVTSFFDLSAAVENTTSEFVIDPVERNNESSAVLLGIHYDRPRMFVDLSVGQREGEASEPGSTFPEYSEVTGSYYLNYRLARPVELEGRGNRSIVYGLFVGNPYFLENRNGAGIRFRLGERVIFRTSADVGTNDYPQPVIVGGDRIVERSDDVMSYGAGLVFRVWRRAALEINASRTEYDSNIDGFDRSVLRVTTGLTFRGEFFQ